jgi:hypothetical protein
MASLHHYEEKSKRVSLREYGNGPQAIRVQHVLSKSLDGGRPRVVELGSDDSVPLEGDEARPRHSGTRGFPPPLVAAKSAQVIPIARKPVGSAPQVPPATRSASDSIIFWQLPQKVRRPISPPLTPDDDDDDGDGDDGDHIPSSPPAALGSPWHMQSPRSSPSPPPRPARAKGPPPPPHTQHARFSRRSKQSSSHTDATATSSSSTKSTLRPRPRVTFQDDTERGRDLPRAQQPQQPQQHHSVLPERGDWFVSFLVYVESVATAANWSSVTDWAWWALRVVLVLYVAASLWSIVAAVKDAVMNACAPVFAFCGFVAWVFRK